MMVTMLAGIIPCFAKIGEWLAHFQAYVILCTEHIVVFVLVEGHR